MESVSCATASPMRFSSVPAVGMPASTPSKTPANNGGEGDCHQARVSCSCHPQCAPGRARYSPCRSLRHAHLGFGRYRQHIVPPLQSGLIAPQYGPAAGLLFPQPTLTAFPSAAWLDELAGQGWHLFVDGRTAHCPLNSDQLGLPVFIIGGPDHPETEGIAAAWFDQHNSVAAIVRPDHYVYCGLSTVEKIEEARSASASRKRPVPIARSRKAAVFWRPMRGPST